MPPDFRKPQAKPQPLASVPGFTGFAPMPTGSVSRLMPDGTLAAPAQFHVGAVALSSIKPTAAEAAALKQLGLDPAAPIPVDLARTLDAVRKEMDNVPHMLPVSPETPPLVVNEVDISSLSPEHQQRLATAAQSMLAAGQRMADMPTVAGAGVGVNEALKIASMSGKPVVVDDRPRPAIRPYSPPPEPAPPAADDPWSRLGVQGKQSRPAVAEVRHGENPEVSALREALAGSRADHAATHSLIDAYKSGMARLEAEVVSLREELAAARNAAPDATGAALTQTQCQHCGWDLERPDQTEPAPEDLTDYLAFLLGGPSTRFRKTVEFFDGRVRATFRSMTHREAELCLCQIGHDSRQGKVIGDGEWLRRLQRYRMCCTVESVYYDSVGLIEVPPPGEIPWDPPSPGEPAATVLANLLPYFDETVVSNESISRVVSNEFYAFQRLVEKLEANALNKDFWSGIAARP